MRATCVNMIYELAKRDKRVLFIGSDLSPDMLPEMKREMPERWYMEGITEQNLIGMSAGLALEGFIPYANTIATFITRRCYEQVAVDLCLHLSLFLDCGGHDRYSLALPMSGSSSAFGVVEPY